MKKVTIAGRDWPIRFVKSKDFAGEFCTNPPDIKLGLNQNDEAIIDTFLHEVLEGLLLMRGLRYEGWGKDDDFLFIFDHKQFRNIISDLYLAIRPMLKPSVLLSSIPKKAKRNEKRK